MFVSYNFILFLLLLFLTYYIIPKKYQWVLLLVVSYGFYYIAGVYYPLFILFTSITVWYASIQINKKDKEIEEYNLKIKKGEIDKPTRKEKKEYKNSINKKKKKWLLIALLINLGILAILKYCDFAIDNFNNLTNNELPYMDLIIPMGISFYIFQAIAYLLDIYWAKVKPQKNFFKFALFISYFPQLVQGPISRYNDLSKSLYLEHKFDYKQIYCGILRIIWGFFKKLVIAERVSIAISTLSQTPEQYKGIFVFINILFYSLQLYADFTGGIDITIGISEMLGITVQENFIRPYFSKNITEYWRRWHISMGTWFRDYVFYPLSISNTMRKITMFTKKHFGKGVAKRVAVYSATIITWFLTGLWHGASWNYIVWGLMNGIIILVSQEFEPLYKRFNDNHSKLESSITFKLFRVLRTFLLLSCLKMFDIYSSVGEAFKQFISMFTTFNINQLTLNNLLNLGLNTTDYIILLIGTMLLIIVSLMSRKIPVRKQIVEKNYTLRYITIFMLFFITILLGNYGIGFDVTQFIYNQF